MGERPEEEDDDEEHEAEAIDEDKLCVKRIDISALPSLFHETHEQQRQTYTKTCFSPRHTNEEELELTQRDLQRRFVCVGPVEEGGGEGVCIVTGTGSIAVEIDKHHHTHSTPRRMSVAAVNALANNSHAHTHTHTHTHAHTTHSNAPTVYTTDVCEKLLLKVHTHTHTPDAPPI